MEGLAKDAAMSFLQRLTLTERAVLVCLAIVFLVALSFLPVNDYRYFAEAALAWRSGASQLYDASSQEFYYAPWSLLLTVLLSYLPQQFGQAILNFLSLTGIALSIVVLARTGISRSFFYALLAPFHAALVILGQWDGLVLGGVALAWLAVSRKRPWMLGIALVIIGSKPTNVLLVGLALLYMLRDWPWQLWLKTAVFPLLAVAFSFWACGFDWPIRYVNLIQQNPPPGLNVSFWDLLGLPIGAAVALFALMWWGWSIWKFGMSSERFAWTIVVSMLISPFLTPYHFIGASPALAIILRQHFTLGLGLWVFSLIAFALFAAYWIALIPLPLYLLTVLVVGAVLDYRAQFALSHQHPTSD